MEGGVIVFHGHEVRVHGDSRGKLLANLARKRRFGRLARLDFASGEFPTACEVAVSALGCEYLVIVSDDGRNNVNGFHNSPFRRRIIVVDRIKEAADSLSEAPNLADRSRIHLVIGCDKAYELRINRLLIVSE